MQISNVVRLNMFNARLFNSLLFNSKVFGSKNFNVFLVILLSISSLLSIGVKADELAVTVTKPSHKQPAIRIVALAPHIVEMLFDIGAGGNIVGTVDYADHPKQALDIPRIGGYYGLQIEKLLALKPDLVLAWKTGNKISDLEQLERLGLTVAYSAPENIADVAKELTYFGELTGFELGAKKAADDYLAKLALIRQSNKNKSVIQTFYQLWSEPMMTVNRNTWIDQLMRICQAENVFADNPVDYPQISIENVMVASPELIIIPDEKSDKPQPDIQWHKWPQIPAVKNNQFIHVNADVLHRFSTRMLTGVEDMCTKLDKFR